MTETVCRRAGALLLPKQFHKTSGKPRRWLQLPAELQIWYSPVTSRRRIRPSRTENPTTIAAMSGGETVITAYNFGNGCVVPGSSVADENGIWHYRTELLPHWRNRDSAALDIPVAEILRFFAGWCTAHGARSTYTRAAYQSADPLGVLSLLTAWPVTSPTVWRTAGAETCGWSDPKLRATRRGWGSAFPSRNLGGPTQVDEKHLSMRSGQMPDRSTETAQQRVVGSDTAQPAR